MIEQSKGWIFKRVQVLLLLLLFSLRSLGIEAVVSHTIFYLQESGITKPYIELYWELNPKTIYFARLPDSSYVAQIKTKIVFSSQGNIVAQDQFVLETSPGKNIKDILLNKVSDLHRYMLTAGTIKVEVQMSDVADSMNRFHYTDSVSLNPTGNKPYYSELQVLDTVYSSTAQGTYQKNNMQQIPLCSNFIDNNRNILHFYFELYKTSGLSADKYPLTQRIFISRTDKDYPIPKLSKEDTVLHSDICPYLGSFNIASLSSGNYFLNVTLTNNLKDIVASNSFFFQRFNNIQPQHDTAALAAFDTTIENVNILNLNKTFVAKYSQPEIKAILRMLLPLSDQAEARTINGFLKKPEDLYMRYYIYNFFSNINRKDPKEAWDQYAEKVKEANRLFSSSGTMGYETDRGYVYLKYGRPDEIVTVENEPGSYPYEIWRYNILNTPLKKISNGLFLFFRPPDMITGFRMLYTNASGEASNRAWRSSLYINGRSGGSSNSRAEQYLPNH